MSVSFVGCASLFIHFSVIKLRMWLIPWHDAYHYHNWIVFKLHCHWLIRIISWVPPLPWAEFSCRWFGAQCHHNALSLPLSVADDEFPLTCLSSMLGASSHTVVLVWVFLFASGVPLFTVLCLDVTEAWLCLAVAGKDLPLEYRLLLCLRRAVRQDVEGALHLSPHHAPTGGECSVLW